jgi:hypothetical protein
MAGFDILDPRTYYQKAQEEIKQVGNMAGSLLHQTQAVGQALLTEAHEEVIDPLVQAVRQPVQGLNHSVSNANQLLRMGTFVAGGWLLYTIMTNQTINPNSEDVDLDVDPYLKRQRRS